MLVHQADEGLRVRLGLEHRAAGFELGAQLGSATVQPSAAIADKTSLQLYDGGAVEGVMEWPALLRKLDKIDPSYKN